MFLPHNLASSVRRSKRAKKASPQILPPTPQRRSLQSEGGTEESPMASASLEHSRQQDLEKEDGFRSSRRSVKSKSKSKLNAAAASSNPSLVARGWARISRRATKRRRDKRQRDAAAVVAANDEGGAPTRGGTVDSFVHANLYHQQPSTSAAAANADAADSPRRHCASADAIDEGIEEARNANKNILSRGMDKLRRSFRKSFRRAKSHALTPPSSSRSEPPLSAAASAAKAASKAHVGVNGAASVETTACSVHSGKTYCQPDEAAVRSAACSFHVKYLGAMEVFESRGMHVCETALQHLRSKKGQTKAILYVTGDGIRVVDQESNRGLILDQTIEKVSFCAPDRHNDKGFAYICRDGATKRWMCHGFQSAKESGERLSHAVGCAFTICLEKKRKRDAETAAYKSGQALALITNPSANNFDKAFEAASGGGGVGADKAAARSSRECGSFRRQLSIAERKMDPQTAIIVKNTPPAQPQPSLFTTSATTTTTTTSAGNPAHSPPTRTATGASDFAPAENGAMNFGALNNFVAPLSNASSGAQGNLQFSTSTPSPMSSAPLSMVKPRPAANPSLFERQGSFKAPLQALPNSFKRFNSLRADSTAANRCPAMKTLHNEPIYEGDDENFSAELCSLNFNNFAAFPNSASSSGAFYGGGGGEQPAGNLPYTDTTPKRQIHTSQSFGGNVSLPLEFHEQFVRGGEKRASRADEWLAQILKTSTANGANFAPTTSSTVSNNFGAPQSGAAYNALNAYSTQNGGDASYFNLAQMTPSSSFLGAPGAPLKFPQSFSADAIAAPSQPNASFGRYASPSTYSMGSAAAAAAGGVGFSGPPPNQPPPPLPPSVASRVGGSAASSVTPLRNGRDELDARGMLSSQVTPRSSYCAPNLFASGATAPPPTAQSIQSSLQNNVALGSATAPPSLSTLATKEFSAQAQARKPSAARMSIEYQLLEETDAPPQSPPRINSPPALTNGVVANVGALEITPSTLAGSRNKSVASSQLDPFGQSVFNAPFTSTTNASVGALNSTRNDANSAQNASRNETPAKTSNSKTTLSPTGACSAESAISAIRASTRSSLEQAESAISALHNSTKSDDPFDVKWSEEVLQKSALRKSSAASQQKAHAPANNSSAPLVGAAATAGANGTSDGVGGVFANGVNGRPHYHSHYSHQQYSPPPLPAKTLAGQSFGGAAKNPFFAEESASVNV